MRRKICSVVWSNLNDGVKWCDGDFRQNQNLSQSDELRKMQKAFEKETRYTKLTARQIGELSKECLEACGYEVAFNEFIPCLNEAMSKKEVKQFIYKLKHEKEVKFKFKKMKDHTIRKARGTLDPETIKKGLTSKDIDNARKRHKIPDTVIVYWDLDRKMFRSFRKSNFIGYFS